MAERAPRSNPSLHRLAARLVAASLLAGLAGCTANRAYHACFGQCRDDERPVQVAADHTLAFVEFDDQGWLHDERQLDAVRDSVAAAAADPRGGGVIVVSFVHGWAHNAALGDENLRFFESALAQLAQVERGDADTDGRPARRVVGVYFGWRGRVYPWKLNGVTFWNRKATAHRIGERALTDAVLSLRDAVPRSVGSGGGADGRAPNRFVLIGHSFGGAALFSATSQLVLERFETPGQSAARRTADLADLVVLINPAFEAARLEPLLRAANRKGSRAVQLGVFTSESDRATGVAFPLGRVPSMFYLSHRRHVESPFEQGPPLSQYASNRSAVGHYQGFVTHRLRRIDASRDPQCHSGGAPLRQPEESPLVQDALPPVAAAAAPNADAAPAATATAAPSVGEAEATADAERQRDPARRRLVASESRAQQQVLKQKTAEGSLTLPLPGIGLCLESTQPGNRQYGVFNVRVDSDLLDGHGIAQGAKREKAFMAFLAEFIRYGASQNTGMRDAAAEAAEGF